MSPEAKSSSQAAIEVQMQRKVLQFKKIVDRKLMERLNYDSGSSKWRSMHFKDSFKIVYYKDLVSGSSYFAIEDPSRDIDFEFSCVDEVGVERTIFGASLFDYDSKSPEGDILDIDVSIASRLLSKEELEELIVFMRNPKEFINDGPPDSLVGISPDEEAEILRRRLRLGRA
jgi:hypothetical protein